VQGVSRRTGRWLALVAAAGLLVAGCGGNTSSDTGDGGDGAAAACGDLNMAINPWVGYEASAYVVGQLAEDYLGCTVNYKPLKEQVSWQGFGTGDVDVVIENWGHDDLKAKYIDQLGTATDLGPNGNVGVIGWYVPPWLAKGHPDILDWQNLNKYASNFETSESAPLGQLLDGDPSYVTNDEALVKNLGLDYKVVYAGSEPALIQAFRQAEKNQDWVIGYFYEPQWFFSEVPLAQVKLPPYKEGCDSDPAKVDCAYPKYILDKIASTDWVDANTSAVPLVKNFKWSNDDQNVVAKYIAQDGMEPADAAQKWIDENPDVWEPWFEGTGVTPTPSAS
jgi:glycine betaine/proline transport system substrate-binding protein